MDMLGIALVLPEATHQLLPKSGLTLFVAIKIHKVLWISDVSKESPDNFVFQWMLCCLSKVLCIVIAKHEEQEKK